MAVFQNAYNQAINRFSGGLLGWLFGDEHTPDTQMTANRALTYSTVYDCVNKYCGSFVKMPLNTHREVGRNKTIQTRHSSYQLMRWRPNAYQKPSDFKRQMICHYLLWGNARAYIRREGSRPVELIPIRPDQTASMLIDGVKWHATVADPNDRLTLFEAVKQKPESLVWLSDANVWHVFGTGFDGIQGLSMIHLARQSWGIGLDSEKHIAKQQKKGYAGGLMLEAPAGVFDKQKDAEEFLEHFNKHHAGAENTGTIGLLRQGIKANVMAMSNTDSQFIENRRFQREEVASWFGLSGIIGDNSGNSYASQEQKTIDYRTNCIGPIATAIEEECDLKLLTESERMRGYYHKFNDGALMRTEKGATMAFISQGITSRVLNPNEAREMLDLNPYEGGDEYVNPNTIARGSETEVEPEEADEEEAAAVRTATRSRIEHMIGVECNKVAEAAKRAAESGKNFLQWVDNFYDRNWQPKLIEVFEELGLGDARAVAYCDESRRRLLDCCDYSTPENLRENVEKCVFSWKIRTY